ncbi:uncharacterized protein LOC112575717 [Pomacea canaliculata]|uniref:uncharacterized protein LOC112575717 n=1 Tax=Pomacea canaliculata TaxID=400727 RepID=UPI000D725D36|nr:uncharacterized protein LOC112575717 [Pomacea canaliculata]
MSGHPSSAQGQRPKRRGGRQSCSGGGRVKVYLHAVTDEQAALLTDTVNTRPLEEVKKNTGADVEFDPNPSPVPGMKILIVRGVPSQIEAAVKHISQKTGLKEPLPDQAQTFWLQWVEDLCRCLGASDPAKIPVKLWKCDVDVDGRRSTSP